MGEMSRVLIARELIRRPKMLILDEPFEGLDAFGRQEMVAIVNRLAVAGLPIILATHRAEEVLPATTHLLTIERERISGVQRVNPFTWTKGNRLAVDTQQFKGFTSKMAPSRDPTRRQTLSEPLIDMQAVTVKYGDLIVLDRLNWRVRAGEHWVISGPNGAGKSTLLKLITGDCLQVYANRIRLFGRRRGADQSLWEIRQKLGVVSPDVATAYQKQMSALDVVCSGFFDSVGLYRHCRAGQIESAQAWLKNFGIDELSGTRFNRLSQGQRQLVLLARAMVKEPDLLILDEPCSGLDPDNRCIALDLIGGIGRHQRTGLIYVSHHEQEIPDCITHRLVLKGGKAVQCGPFQRPSINTDVGLQSGW
jgi:molybdate transport system ATP-binding protein